MDTPLSPTEERALSEIAAMHKKCDRMEEVVIQIAEQLGINFTPTKELPEKK